MSWINSLFEWKPGERRWPHAAGAALCIFIPVAAGWALSDPSAGLVASLGSFTALYGYGRPYQIRSAVLLVVALGIAQSVIAGSWFNQYGFLAVLVLVPTAVIATFVANALDLGMPGAYMFVLAAAAGTNIPTAQAPLWTIYLLVLAGGLMSVFIQSFVSAIAPHTTEKTVAEGSADKATAEQQRISMERSFLRANVAAWRVFLAAIVAIGIGHFLGLDRVYWIVSTAVLILHQGLDLSEAFERALQRTIGTFAGLSIAATVMLLAPSGLALAFTLALLQFMIEITITRNTTIAAFFITGIAISTTSAMSHTQPTATILYSRGIDTMIGCAVAMLVLLCTVVVTTMLRKVRSHA